MTSNQDDESLNPFARQHGCHSLDTIPYHLGASNSKLGGYYAICWRDDKDGPRCAVIRIGEEQSARLHPTSATRILV